MVQVSIYTNADRIYTGFKVLGHAGFAERGQDIVCSAVSVLVINTINSIEQFTSDRFSLNTDEEIGLIDFNMNSPISGEAILLLKSLVLGLEAIEQNYGNEYIKLKL